jgi:iron complex transport system substrate-binding protein
VIHRLTLLLFALACCAQAFAAPPRIVSLAPNLTELVFAAGAGDMLVGTVEFSDFPAAALQIERIGDAWRIDLERLLVLRPDLVLAWPSGTPEDTLERIRALGLEVVLLPTYRLEDVPAALRSIGSLTGRNARAAQVALEFERQVAELRTRYRDRPALSVFIQLDDEPLYTVNGQHVISEIVELCGGRNVFADLAQLAPPVSPEAVLARDPQVILSTDDTIGEPLAQWSSRMGMQAVRAGTIYGLSSDTVARATPRLVEGIESVCTALEDARARLATGN